MGSEFSSTKNLYRTRVCWTVLNPTGKEKSYRDRTWDLFNILPMKFNTLLSPLPWLYQVTQKKFRIFSVQARLNGSSELHVGRKMANFQLFFSVQGTGGSPTGPDLENRVRDQDIGILGSPVSSGLQVPGEPGHCRGRKSPWLPSGARRFCFKLSFNCTSRDECRKELMFSVVKQISG
jgi:hypothetical protein